MTKQTTSPKQLIIITTGDSGEPMTQALNSIKAKYPEARIYLISSNQTKADRAAHDWAFSNADRYHSISPCTKPLSGGNAGLVMQSSRVKRTKDVLRVIIAAPGQEGRTKDLIERANEMTKPGSFKVWRLKPVAKLPDAAARAIVGGSAACLVK